MSKQIGKASLSKLFEYVFSPLLAFHSYSSNSIRLLLRRYMGSCLSDVFAFLAKSR